jgi:hypothetical protein
MEFSPGNNGAWNHPSNEAGAQPPPLAGNLSRPVISRNLALFFPEKSLFRLSHGRALAPGEGPGPLVKPAILPGHLARPGQPKAEAGESEEDNEVDDKIVE